MSGWDAGALRGNRTLRPAGNTPIKGGSAAVFFTRRAAVPALAVLRAPGGAVVWYL